MSALSSHDVAAAEIVLDQFLDATRLRDADAARALVTESCQGLNLDAMPSGTIEYRKEDAFTEGEMVIVPVHANVVEDPSQNPPCAIQHVLVRENGEWRVDMDKSMERTFGFSPEGLMDEMASAMGEALGDTFGQIGEALGEAFGSSSESSSEEDGFDEEGEWNPLDSIDDDWAEYLISSHREYQEQVEGFLQGLGVEATFEIDYGSFYQKKFYSLGGAVDGNITQGGIHAFGSGIGDLIQDDPDLAAHVSASLRVIRLTLAETPEEIGMSVEGSTIEYRFAPHVYAIPPDQLEYLMDASAATLAPFNNGDGVSGGLDEADFRRRLEESLRALDSAAV